MYILGEGKLRDDLTNQIERCGVSDCFTLLGAKWGLGQGQTLLCPIFLLKVSENIMTFMKIKFQRVKKRHKAALFWRKKLKMRVTEL